MKDDTTKIRLGIFVVPFSRLISILKAFYLFFYDSSKIVSKTDKGWGAMLKDERFNAILSLIEQEGTVKVNEIVERLNVSDMTVRRDLSELEEQGKLKRVHGGATGLSFNKEELSHFDKLIIRKEQKIEIAKKTLDLIEEDETIFLGPGTTLEILAELMNYKSIRVVTNCLPVFQALNQKEGNHQIYLLGGELRQKTQAFVGEITNNALENMRFNKAFFSCNALKGNDVMTATIEEGRTQSIALDNAIEKYLLIDSSKIGKEDFYSYYNLQDITAVVMDRDEQESYRKIEKNVSVIL